MQKLKMIVRPIERKDYQSAAAIWREVLDVRNATDDSVSGIYEKMKDDQRYQTFVAEADGRIVGLVTTVEVLAVGHPDGYIKINGLGVRPEYRGQGIGRLLLERAEELARERGALYLGLATGIRRQEAHAFYEHLGWQKTSYWFRKNLE